MLQKKAATEGQLGPTCEKNQWHLKKLQPWFHNAGLHRKGFPKTFLNRLSRAHKR